MLIFASLSHTYCRPRAVVLTLCDFQFHNTKSHTYCRPRAVVLTVSDSCLFLMICHTYCRPRAVVLTREDLFHHFLKSHLLPPSGGSFDDPFALTFTIISLTYCRPCISFDLMACGRDTRATDAYCRPLGGRCSGMSGCFQAIACFSLFSWPVGVPEITILTDGVLRWNQCRKVPATSAATVGSPWCWHKKVQLTSSSTPWCRIRPVSGILVAFLRRMTSFASAMPCSR